MKENIVKQCLDLLKREDIKNDFIKPVINFILHEVNPYLYFIVGCICLIFITNIAFF
jgi:hypothetical protein